MFRNGKRLLPCFILDLDEQNCQRVSQYSLKNSRDRFDSWLSDVRVPAGLTSGALLLRFLIQRSVYQRMSVLSDSAIEQRVLFR